MDTINSQTTVEKRSVNNAPHVSLVREQMTALSYFVIGIANYVFQKVLLLNLYKAYLQFVLFGKLQILVDTLQTQIDGLRFEVLHKIPFIGKEIFLVDFLVMFKEIRHRPYIRCDSVFCQIGLGKIQFELCYHIDLFNEW